MGWQPAIWPPRMKYLSLTSHFQTAFQEEIWPLRPITTAASLSATQKHFDWAVQVLLAYKKHLQVNYSKADFVPKCFALSISLQSSSISSLLVKI